MANIERKKPGAILDISRLVSRIDQRTPTGIDRVELRYAEWLLSSEQFLPAFVRQNQDRFEIVPYGQARRIVDYLEARWSSSAHNLKAPVFPPTSNDPNLPYLPGSLVSFIKSTPRNIYLNVSHHGIDREKLFLPLFLKWQMRFAFYIHDMLPIQFPEYVKTADPQNHKSRIKNVLRLDSTILTNSGDTRNSLMAWCKKENLGEPSPYIFHIGLEKQFSDSIAVNKAPADQPGAPYFVMVGTIEPRKNHALILNIWRRLCETRELADVPDLYIIGKRGWDSDSIFAYLERCAGIQSKVHELSHAEDRKLRELISGSRALLFPSFGEGWGMPLVEALAMGVPAICSDIPVFREASQNLAEFIDPLDAITWMNTVLDYAAPHSLAREAQLKRLPQYQSPRWKNHFLNLQELLDRELSKQNLLQRGPHEPGQFRLESKRKLVDHDKFELFGFLRRSSYDELVRQADQHREACDHETAARLYKGALAMQPHQPQIWIQYGHMLKEYGDYQTAFFAYAKAFELMPQDADLHIQMGHLLKMAGRPEDSNQYYRLAHDLDPSCDALTHLT